MTRPSNQEAAGNATGLGGAEKARCGEAWFSGLMIATEFAVIWALHLKAEQE